MATKKDLVQAQSFSRRRLTTAFVSGAPGGREVEPTKPLKAVIGSITLSILLVLGGLALGLLKGGLPDKWDDNSLVVTKQSGARYVAIRGTLYPVINTTSARLLIPADSFKIVTVDDEQIASTERGPTIGILGAPDSLPPPSRLVDTGWTSCVSPTGGTHTTVSATPGVRPATDRAVVVRTGGRTFVMSGGFRYPVDPKHEAAVLRALGLDVMSPIKAPGLWTNLWPLGPTLGPVSLRNVGAKAPGKVPDDAVVGSVLSVSGAGATPRKYVLLPNGELALLSPVAEALYRIGAGRDVGPDVQVSNAQLGSLRTSTDAFVSPKWPTAMPRPLAQTACVTLDSGPGAAPTTQLTTASDATAPARGHKVEVDPGVGSLVRAVSGGALDHGPIMVVAQTGSAYPVAREPEDILQRLGYTPENITPVPQAWVDLFDPGPELAPGAAESRVAGSAGSGGPDGSS